MWEGLENQIKKKNTFNLKTANRDFFLIFFQSLNIVVYYRERENVFCLCLFFNLSAEMIDPPFFGGNFFQLVDCRVHQEVKTAELVSVVVLLRHAEHRTGLGHVEGGLVQKERGWGHAAAIALAVVQTAVAAAAAAEVFDWAQLGGVWQCEVGAGGWGERAAARAAVLAAMVFFAAPARTDGDQWTGRVKAALCPESCNKYVLVRYLNKHNLC